MGEVMTATQSSKKKVLDWGDVTDWYIPEQPDRDAIIYPGAFRVRQDANSDQVSKLRSHVDGIRAAAVWQQAQEQPAPVDFTLKYNGAQLRVHRQSTVQGAMFVIRRIPTKLPILDQLGLPAEIVQFLRLPVLADTGGLIVIAGSTGQGKSTTCAASLLARVSEFGHFGLTVEDPAEFPLQGEYESSTGRVGQIIQVPAQSKSFAHDLRDALRCYPSNSKGSMLMVGEIRDPDAAAQLLQAAVNGQLVFATVHAGDVIACLERILSLAEAAMGSNQARNLLAHSLRAVLHQRLTNKRALEVSPLISLSGHSSVAGNIKTNLSSLSSVRERQKTLLGLNKLLDGLQEEGKD